MRPKRPSRAEGPGLERASRRRGRPDAKFGGGGRAAVIVADEPGQHRHTAAALLRHRFRVVGATGDLDAALEMIDRCAPAVLILDLRGPSRATVIRTATLRGFVDAARDRRPGLQVIAMIDSLPSASAPNLGVAVDGAVLDGDA